jgi:transcriptional regulator with XRE-family HTH domain
MRQQNIIDTLGGVVKSARQSKGITQVQLAERLGITPRYLVAIEKEQKKPSYDLLFELIRELDIPADSIFYPEHGYDRTEIERLRLLLEMCDTKEVNAITSTLQTLLEGKKSNGR